MEFLAEFLVALITATITAVLTWMRKNSYDIKFEDKYAKYSMLYQVSGEVVKSIDEKLYKEMEDCIKQLTLAYQSPEFTTSMFNSLVKEAQELFDYVEDLLKNRG